MSSTPPQPPGEALRECLKTAVIELPVSLYLFFLSSHGHPFGEVGLDPFDMLNEFPDLSGGSSGGASAGASPYVGSPPGGGSSASSGAAAVGGSGGLLTTSPNAPAPMLASSSAKGKSRHGGGVGGATGAASAAAPAELAQITDYSPEWAWSDVSRGRRETLALPPPPSSTVLLLKLCSVLLRFVTDDHLEQRLSSFNATLSFLPLSSKFLLSDGFPSWQTRLKVTTNSQAFVPTSASHRINASTTSRI